MPKSPRLTSPAIFNSTSRHHRMVFVDPDDPTLPYWWAALIVPEEEWELFREAMDSDVQTVKPSEVLVCYFEDGSYSVVPRTALTPFHPERDPYLAYAKENKRFGEEEAIRLATNFWRLGEIPPRFKWLRMMANADTSERKSAMKVLSPPPTTTTTVIKRKRKQEEVDEIVPTKPANDTTEFRLVARFVPPTRMQRMAKPNT